MGPETDWLQKLNKVRKLNRKKRVIEVWVYENVQCKKINYSYFIYRLKYVFWKPGRL